jgi:hypothetical protein
MLKRGWGGQYLQLWTSEDQIKLSMHDNQQRTYFTQKGLTFHFKAPLLTGPVWHKWKPSRDTKIREQSNLALLKTCHEEIFLKKLAQLKSFVRIILLKFFFYEIAYFILLYFKIAIFTKSCYS